MARYDRVVPPGGQGKIRLKVYTHGMSGNFRKYALVYTNDPQHSTFKIYLEGSVIPWVKIEPEESFALYGVVGSKMERSITLCPGRKEKPLKILSVSNPYPDKVSHDLTPLGDGCYRLTVANKMAEPGSYFGRFRVETGYPEKQYVDVRFSCIVAPKVELYPLRVHLGSVKKNEDKPTREVTVQSNLQGELRIESISYNKKLLMVTVDESRAKEGRLYLTLVMDPDGLPEGGFREEVVLSFKEGNIEPVTLTVLGQVVR